MIADEKFRRGKGRKVVVSFYASMNLASGSWVNDDERVELLLKNEIAEDAGRLEWFHIKMSRVEAKRLGEALLRYANMKLEGESPLTSATERVG